MLPDYYGSDYDYAEAHGNGETLADVEVSLADELARLHIITARMRDKYGLTEHSTHRCRHGINLERAACGQCMREDEDMGAAMAARWEKQS